MFPYCTYLRVVLFTRGYMAFVLNDMKHFMILTIMMLAMSSIFVLSDFIENKFPKFSEKLNLLLYYLWNVCFVILCGLGLVVLVWTLIERI